MTDLLAQILIGVVVGLFAALPTALLLIAFLKREPVPWREYLHYFRGKWGR